MIFRDKPDGHSDQVPYILIWQDMIENPPPWLKPFLPPKAGPTEILALWKAKKETDSMPEAPLHLVFQDSSLEDLILPPPYPTPPRPPPHQRHRGLQKGHHPSLTRESLCAGQQRGHTVGPTGRPHLRMWGQPTPPPFFSAPWGPPVRLANS